MLGCVWEAGRAGFIGLDGPGRGGAIESMSRSPELQTEKEGRDKNRLRTQSSWKKEK